MEPLNVQSRETDICTGYIVLSFTESVRETQGTGVIFDLATPKQYITVLAGLLKQLGKVLQIETFVHDSHKVE